MEHECPTLKNHVNQPLHLKYIMTISRSSPTRTCMVFIHHTHHEFRQRGDSNPCGQSPMDFESISLAARTHCLGGIVVMAAVCACHKPDGGCNYLWCVYIDITGPTVMEHEWPTMKHNVHMLLHLKYIMAISRPSPTSTCMVFSHHTPHAFRQRGDSNPCGQSPMDFESISLAARTHCLGGVVVMAALCGIHKPECGLD